MHSWRRPSARVGFPALLIVVALLLASCGEDLRLHTGTDADLKRSHARIMERLPAEEASIFDQALRDIVIQRMGMGRSPETMMLSAELDAFPAAVSVSTALSYASEMAGAIAGDWEQQRVKALRENAAALLDRRTVPEILEIARQEREHSSAQSLATVNQLVERGRARLREAERRLSALRADAVPDAAIMAGISVSGQTLMLSRRSGVEEPTLSFTLRNETAMQPGRIYFLARVSRGGLDPRSRRAVIAYDIPGGLQPNASQRHVITLTRLLEGTLGKDAALFQVEVDLAPIAMENARGRKAGAPDVADLTIDRIIALRDLVARIEAHAGEVASAGPNPPVAGADDAM